VPSHLDRHRVVQIPFQNWYVDAIKHFWGSGRHFQLVSAEFAFPLVLLSGLVSGSSQISPDACLLVRRRSLTPKAGLIIGAVSGAGFGVFEAIWVHNRFLFSGVSWLSWTIMRWDYGSVFLAWLSISRLSALTGWGIANGKVGCFMLIAAFLHGIVNLVSSLIEDNKLTAVQSEIYLTVIACYGHCYHVMAPLANRKRNSRGNPPAGTAGDTLKILPLVTPDTAALSRGLFLRRGSAIACQLING